MRYSVFELENCQILHVFSLPGTMRRSVLRRREDMTRPLSLSNQSSSYRKLARPAM
jgi:hypothetical protein